LGNWYDPIPCLAFGRHVYQPFTLYPLSLVLDVDLIVDHVHVIPSETAYLPTAEAAGHSQGESQPQLFVILRRVKDLLRILIIQGRRLQPMEPRTGNTVHGHWGGLIDQDIHLFRRPAMAAGQQAGKQALHGLGH
jgi:hypothetical protein